MSHGQLSTRERIYAAAVVEFAARGLSGATIDGIARRASANRERVYFYFGNKATLFRHVANTELTALSEAVLLDIHGPHDVGVFAGAAFDYQLAHPYLARLVIWEGLEYSDPTEYADDERGLLYQNKAATVALAQARGEINDELDAGALIFLVISLASYWLAAPQLAQFLVSEEPRDVAHRRNSVVTAAVILSAPRSARP